MHLVGLYTYPQHIQTYPTILESGYLIFDSDYRRIDDPVFYLRQRFFGSPVRSDGFPSSLYRGSVLMLVAAYLLLRQLYLLKPLLVILTWVSKFGSYAGVLQPDYKCVVCH